MIKPGPIGIFDSGYGGLTVMKEIVRELPEYDYLYLGDNARTPYGTRSYETIYEFTLECVRHMFDQGCELVILACNTASAKALRTIQQRDLPGIDPTKRVLGVIRPTAEVIGNYSNTGNVGILGTPGTMKSESYLMEIKKQFPSVSVFQHACPMWVPLVENGETHNAGADYFVKKDISELLKMSAKIDTILLACTHYPLLEDTIKKHLPEHVKLLTQGSIVAQSLKDYLKRHPEMDLKCSKGSTRAFLTTDSPQSFDQKALIFYGESTHSKFVRI
ncbi:MAG: glutamate racemase [Cyclobacteriaceae bacterium]